MFATVFVDASRFIDFPVVFIEEHPFDFGRVQGVADKFFRRLFVLNDVDVFAAQLVDDRLNPGPAWSHASPDWVNVFVAGEDGHLGPVTGFTHDPLNFHDPLLNFRHFLFKEPLEQVRTGPGNEDQRPAGAALVVDPGHVNLDPVVHPVVLVWHLVMLVHGRFHTVTEVDVDVAFVFS